MLPSRNADSWLHLRLPCAYGKRSGNAVLLTEAAVVTRRDWHTSKIRPQFTGLFIVPVVHDRRSS
eukprot:scaffold22146_cov140-Skeletonema_menzelii.AAC.1